MSVFIARGLQRVLFLGLLVAVLAGVAPHLSAQIAQPEGAEAAAAATTTEDRAGGEVNLVLPDLSIVDFGGISGRSISTEMGQCAKSKSCQVMATDHGRPGMGQGR